MTFSAKRTSGMFRKSERSKPVNSSAAFSPASSSHPGNTETSPTTPVENPFATDAFVPVDHEPRRVSVTSLESTTSIEPFEEDPFKNCDPFSNLFPAISEDPFETSADDPFSTEAADPFSDASGTLDPFSDSKSDPFADSSDAFASNAFGDAQSSHPPSAAVGQTALGVGKLPAVIDKFESVFGDANKFLDQKMTAGSQSDPFVPAGSKLPEMFGNENPFAGDSFSQVQTSNKTGSDPFSVSGESGVAASVAQSNEKGFGDDGFLDQKTTAADSQNDPFLPAGSKRVEVFASENPFEGDSFVQVRPTATTGNDPFSVSGHHGVASSVAQSKENPFGADSFSNQTPPVTKQATNPFGVAVSESQPSERQSVDNPFGDDKFQPSMPSAMPSNASDAFASSKATPSDCDPFAPSATSPAVKYDLSNPFQLDSFVKGQDPVADQVVESTKQVADVQPAGRTVSAALEQEVGQVAMGQSTSDHHVKFPDDSRIATTFDTYSR